MPVRDRGIIFETFKLLQRVPHAFYSVVREEKAFYLFVLVGRLEAQRDRKKLFNSIITIPNQRKKTQRELVSNEIHRRAMSKKELSAPNSPKRVHLTEQNGRNRLGIS